MALKGEVETVLKRAGVGPVDIKDDGVIALIGKGRMDHTDLVNADRPVSGSEPGLRAVADALEKAGFRVTPSAKGTALTVSRR